MLSMKEWGKVPKDRGEFIEDKFVIHQAGSKWIASKCNASACHSLQNGAPSFNENIISIFEGRES